MNTRTLKVLAVLVIVLFAAVFALTRQRDDNGEPNQLLFPELKDRLDEVTEVRIADADSEVTITRTDDGWVVPDKAGYAANAGALRELLLAVAEARKVEQKTSNSELYERLGVQDPTNEGSSGVLVESVGLGNDDFSLIFGDPVQREYRYVRLADAKESWLIDRNPEIPEGASGWLTGDIVDLPSSSIQSVTITHPDGETIRMHKADADATNFAIEGIPEGRELSYPSVGNSVAAALSTLTLEDVRASAEAEDAAAGTTTTVLTTFDGLRVAVQSSAGEDRAGEEVGENEDTDEEPAPEETWITLEASVIPDAGAEGPQAEEGAAEPDTQAADTEPGNADAESSPGNDDETSPDAPDASEAEASGESGEAAPAETEEPELDPAERAAAINERVSGWQYRIPAYKANQLTRRWEDLLTAEE